jgi:hypothetical protein
MSTITTTPAPTTRAPRPFNPSRFAIVATAAAALNLITYGIGSASGASMGVTAPAAQEIPPALAVIATLLPMAAAGLVPWFIARRRAGFRRFSAWTGLVVGILTAASPLASSADVPTGVALGFMHIVVGIAWFTALRSSRVTE